jgi:polyisoprenoid-binding protein YceI
MRGALLFVGLGLAGLIGAGGASAQSRPIPPSTVAVGRLSFDGHATVGDFTGVTTTVQGSMTGGAEVGAVRGCISAPVATLVTGNDHRDRDLRKSMEVEKFPAMRFELLEVGKPGGGPDSMSAPLIGDLTLHGVTRHDTLAATLTWSGDSLRVRTEFPVNLKDYKIGGLSKMLGILKMHENIVVHVDLVFLPDPSATGRCPDSSAESSGGDG